MRSLGKRGEGGEGALGWPHGDPGHGSIEAFPAVEHGRPKDAIRRLIDALFANVARRFSGDSIRTTVEQNLVLRWVSETDLPDLYRELVRIGVAAPGAALSH